MPAWTIPPRGCHCFERYYLATRMLGVVSSTKRSSRTNTVDDHDRTASSKWSSHQQQESEGKGGLISTVLLKGILLTLLVSINTTGVMVARYALTSPSADGLNTNRMILVTEIGKCVASCVCETIITRGRLAESFMNSLSKRPQENLKPAIPALLYLLQNILIYFAVSRVSPPLMKVLLQGKLVTTAIVSYILLGRKYRVQQYFCLFFLTVGVAIVVAEEGSFHDRDTTLPGEGSSLLWGIMAICAACLLGDVAGVYFEMVLKATSTVLETGQMSPVRTKPISMWIRNMQLAIFTILILFVQECWSGRFFNIENYKEPYLRGFSGWVWLLIATRVAQSIVITAVLKYADNVLKGIAACLSLCLCAVLSSILFGTLIGSQFWFGSLLVVLSAFVFLNPIERGGFKYVLSKRGVELLLPFVFLFLVLWVVFFVLSKSNEVYDRELLFLPDLSDCRTKCVTRQKPCPKGESEYLRAYPDVADAVKQGFIDSGFQHFKSHGVKENRNYFCDENEFRMLQHCRSSCLQEDSERKSLQPLATEPLDCETKCFARQKPCPEGESEYLAAYPDVADSVKQGVFDSGFQHFKSHGAKENRNYFCDENEFTLLQHCRSSCLQEDSNRKSLQPLAAEPLDCETKCFTRQEPCPEGERKYLAAYPDVADSVKQGVFDSGFQHYKRHGVRNNRNYFCDDDEFRLQQHCLSSCLMEDPTSFTLPPKSFNDTFFYNLITHGMPCQGIFNGCNIRYARPWNLITEHSERGNCGKTMDVLQWLTQVMDKHNETMILFAGGLIKVLRDKTFFWKNGTPIDEDIDLLVSFEALGFLYNLEPLLWRKFGWTTRTVMNCEGYSVFVQLIAACGHVLSNQCLKAEQPEPSLEFYAIREFRDVAALGMFWGQECFPSQLILPARRHVFQPPGNSSAIDFYIPRYAEEWLSCTYSNWSSYEVAALSNYKVRSERDACFSEVARRFGFFDESLAAIKRCDVCYIERDRILSGAAV